MGDNLFQVMDSKSISFVKENMELFGFGNADDALFTSFVEVLDNSVDAVLNNPNPMDEPTIRVSLMASRVPNEFTLSTVDNGSPRVCG